MAGKKIEMNGRVFGMLTVLDFDRQSGKNVYWTCECSCGILKAMDGQYLRNAANPSCGCQRVLNQFKVKEDIHSIPGHRRCCACKVHKPLNSDSFYTDIGKVGGLSYCCIECNSSKQKRRYSNNPYATWKNKDKEVRLQVGREYRNTPKGRAIFVRKSYRKVDEYKGRLSDLTVEFVHAEILKPCTYCGDDNFMNMGLDRLDNNLGHTMDNSIPCCDECNVARSNHFTYEEMMEIGAVIKRIKANRIKNPQPLQPHLN